VSSHDETVVIMNAIIIIEQALIHRLEVRRAVSRVRVFGQRAATPLHRLWV